MEEIAQPPVAFSFNLSSTVNGDFPQLTETKLVFDKVELDTDNGSNGTGYVVQKSGIYSLNARVRFNGKNPNNLIVARLFIKKGSIELAQSWNTHIGAASAGQYVYTLHDTPTATTVVELEKGDVIDVLGYMETDDGANAYISAEGALTQFSGHMISSITEGEVKEKEPVVFNAGITTAPSLSSAVYTDLNLDKIEIDTNNSIVDGKFQPNVAGWYNISASVTVGDIGQTLTLVRVLKNGITTLTGTNVASNHAQGSRSSNGSTVVYLNGVDDALTLQGFVNAPDGKRTLSTGISNTFLSASLITGQSSGGGSGGGGEAQPPVAFKGSPISPIKINEANKEFPVPLVTTSIDTNSGLKDGKYIIPEDGIYNVEGGLEFVSNAAVRVVQALIYVNGVQEKYLNESLLSEDVNGVTACYSSPRSTLLQEFKKDDEIELRALASDTYPSLEIRVNSYLEVMKVSSFTEGEVKEKEAVVFKGELSAEQTIGNEAWTVVNLDTVGFGDSSYLTPEGYFRPNVAGYYQISGAVGQFTNVDSPTWITSQLRKNSDNSFCVGGSSYNGTAGYTSTVSSIIYFNGSTDYVELRAYMKGTGVCAVASSSAGNTYFTAHLITGQSSGGSGGGGTTDILPVLYSGYITADGTVYKGEGFTCTKGATGQYIVTLDKPVARTSSVTATTVAGTKSIGYQLDNGDYDLHFYVRDLLADADYSDASFSFTVTDTETIAVGGGSGGGDYTPEKMVWEEYPIGSDPVTERNFDTAYTNTNDVPLYVQFNFASANLANQRVRVWIDDVEQGMIGTGSGAARTELYNPLYIVPSKGNIRLESVTGNTSPLLKWFEAKMPLAIGTGGKTVAFRGELSADQSAPSTTWTKVNLNTASIDSNNALIDGKFKPSVAGYYQVNGSVRINTAKRVISAIYKNGVLKAWGSNGNSDTDNYVSNVNDIFYLNGTTDYLELMSYYVSAVGSNIRALDSETYLSAVLVSGGSASGDSAEEMGFDVLTPPDSSIVSSVGLSLLPESTMLIPVKAGRRYVFEWTGEARCTNTTAVNTLTQIAFKNGDGTVKAINYVGELAGGGGYCPISPCSFEICLCSTK